MLSDVANIFYSTVIAAPLFAMSRDNVAQCHITESIHPAFYILNSIYYMTTIV